MSNALSPVLLGSLLGLLGLMVSLTAQTPESKSPAASQTRFRFEAVNDKSLGLWEGARPVLVYNHGEVSKPSVPSARSRSTYLHPIYGLDGEVLTDDFPKDLDDAALRRARCGLAGNDAANPRRWQTIFLPLPALDSPRRARSAGHSKGVRYVSRERQS